MQPVPAAFHVLHRMFLQAPVMPSMLTTLQVYRQKCINVGSGCLGGCGALLTWFCWGKCKHADDLIGAAAAAACRRPRGRPAAAGREPAMLTVRPVYTTADMVPLYPLLVRQLQGRKAIRTLLQSWQGQQLMLSWRAAGWHHS
jgi:hypothetical protein